MIYNGAYALTEVAAQEIPDEWVGAASREIKEMISINKWNARCNTPA